jgi:hypothetical protein
MAATRRLEFQVQVHVKSVEEFEMPENKRVGVLVEGQHARFNDWNALVGCPLRAEYVYSSRVEVSVNDRVF